MRIFIPIFCTTVPVSGCAFLATQLQAIVRKINECNKIFASNFHFLNVADYQVHISLFAGAELGVFVRAYYSKSSLTQTARGREAIKEQIIETPKK